MALVAAKCTNCGAALQVDNTKDAAICQHCGSAFIVEKAINHYHISNTITADTVNVYTAAADFVIRAGVLEKYNGAETDVVIPAGVKIIGAKAFEGCIGLTSVVIPEGVTEIRRGCFSGCSNLRTVKLPDSLCKLDEDFAGCTSLEELRIPAGISKLTLKESMANKIILPENMESIEVYEFARYRHVTEFILPEGLKSIGDFAFEGCESLKRIIIPASVATVGKLAFSWCSQLEQVIVLGRETKFLYISDFDNFNQCGKLAEIRFADPVELERQAKAFRGSEWYRRRGGRSYCTHCGGDFTGIFKKKCSKCGRPKDY